MTIRPDAKIVTEWYHPKRPEGYWYSWIESEEGAKVGYYRGDSEEESRTKARAALEQLFVRQREFEKLNEWRSKRWWRRVFKLNPKEAA